MFPYFVKLRNKHDFHDFTMTEHRVSYGQNISYKKAKTIHQEKIFEVIPKQWRHMFGLNVMVITGPVVPHTDSGIKSCINFYIKTDDAVTTFFRSLEPELDDKWKIKNQTDGFVFDSFNLEEIVSFIAEPGDAYALNVARPHSVDEGIKPLNQRVALTLGSTMKFENLCRLLYDTGNLQINNRLR